jgi:integrase
VFFHYCQQVEIVSDGFVDKVPEVKVSSKARDEKVDQETAEAILDFLSRFRYASRQHAIFLLIWHTALRTGATRSLDLEDCHLDIEAPYLELHHRPEEDTPLKNREASEREVNLSHNVAEVLQDYTEHNRTDSMDEYGRDPLFTTKQGRVSHYAIANAVYGATRPCVYSDDCPHGRMREECEAGTNVGRASRCPSSHSGHPLRRGSITHAHLDRDVPREVTSDRCDVSVDVLEKHYARQSEERKREIRREYLDRG